MGTYCIVPTSGPPLPWTPHPRVALELPRTKYSSVEGAYGGGCGAGEHPHGERGRRQWPLATASRVRDAPAGWYKGGAASAEGTEQDFAGAAPLGPEPLSQLLL